MHVVAQATTFGHRADLHTVQVPFVEHVQHILFAAFVYHDEHALLALAQENLPTVHAFLTGRHFVQMDLHAMLALGAHLAGAARNACRTHVLHTDNGTRGNHFERGLQQ